MTAHPIDCDPLPRDPLAFELPATDRADITRAATIDSLAGFGGLVQWAQMRGAV